MYTEFFVGLLLLVEETISETENLTNIPNM